MRYGNALHTVFLCGLREFHCNVTTTSFTGARRRVAYDAGRELAHVLTFRRFES